MRRTVPVMPNQYIAAWLPWENMDGQSDHGYCCRWVRQLDEVVMAFTQKRLQLPVYLEGSAALLSWYLPARPERQATIAALFAQGLLYTSGFYSGPVSFLSCGEALVRNHLLGRLSFATAPAAGSAAFLASPLYIAQLPPALAGMKFRTAIVIDLPAGSRTAAVPLKLKTWRWRGADGGAVILARLHPQPDVHSDVAEIVLLNLLHPAGLARATALSGDGAPALALNALPETLLARPTAPHTIEGELVAWPETDMPTALPGCSGCGSIRPPLHQAACRAGQQLIGWAEPWAAAAWISGNRYPDHFIKTAWHRLLLGQQHAVADSGTADAADAWPEALYHIRQAGDIATAITRESLATVVGNPAVATTETDSPAAGSDLDLWAVNPLGFPRSEVLTCQVALPPGADYLQLLAADGKQLPYQLHHNNLPGGPEKAGERQATISFRAEALPAIGFRRYKLTPSTARPYFLGESIAAGNTLENRYLRVGVKPNGALRLEDKRTGSIYDNCNVFEDGGDAGLPAAYSQPEQTRPVTTYAAHVQPAIVENGIFLGVIQVQHNLVLPEGLHPARNRRSDLRVDCEVTSYVTLRHNAPGVEIRTIVTNRASHHRLRVLFSSGIPAAICHVAQMFGIAERATGLFPPGSSLERSTLPMSGFIDIAGDTHGLAVAACDLGEYEIKPTPVGTIAITLLRAGAGSGEESDVAQAPGAFEFNYALIPHAGGWEEALRPGLAFCQPAGVWTAADLLWPAGRNATAGPSEFSLLAVEPASIVLSAIKRSEDGEWLVVRIYNATNQPQRGEIRCGAPLAAVRLATLAETPGPSLPLRPGQSTVPVKLAAAQVQTLLLRPQLSSR